MSAEANKAVIKRLFKDVFNQGKLELIDAIIAEHVLHHDAISSHPIHESPASFKQVACLFQTALPEAQYTLFDLIAECDRVVTRWGLAAHIRGHSWVFLRPTNR